MYDETYVVLCVDLLMQVQYTYLSFFEQFGLILDCQIDWQKNAHSFHIHAKNLRDILLKY